MSNRFNCSRDFKVPQVSPPEDVAGIRRSRKQFDVDGYCRVQPNARGLNSSCKSCLFGQKSGAFTLKSQHENVKFVGNMRADLIYTGLEFAVL